MVRRHVLVPALLVLLFFMFAATRGEIPEERARAGAPGEAGSVVMVLAHEGFRDEEYQVPRSIFEEGGLRVTVASSDTTPAKGMLGLEVKVDILLEDVNVENYDCVIFVGGVGAKEYWDSPVAHSLARAAVELDRVLGAICIAPVILARAGVLRGRKATAFRHKETMEAFRKEGVVYSGDEVTVSGMIVTGRDPKAGKRFAELVLGLLGRQSETEEGE